MYYCFKTQQDGKYLHKIFFFQNIIIKQNIGMKSYVIWEIVLKPLCVLNKSRILWDPQLCWSVLCVIITMLDKFMKKFVSGSQLSCITQGHFYNFMM